MTPIASRFPAFAPAGAAVAAVLIFAGSGLAEIITGFILAVATALIYHKIPGTLRVFAGVLCIVSIRCIFLAPEPFSAPENRWSGVVESVRPTASSQRAIVTLSDDTHQRVALTLTDLTPELFPGDSIEFTSSLCRAGRYMDIRGMRMSGMTERAERISAIATVTADKISVTGHSDDFKYSLSSFRRRIAEAVYASPLSALSADLLVASTLGSGDAPSDLKDSFRAAGVSHLLCVSGFHVGIIAALVSFLLLPLRLFRHRSLRYALLLLIVWSYAFIVGFAPSVVRAGIMLTAYVAARCLQRDASAPNALLVAGAATLIVDPYSMWSAGFQLSFSAVAGILVFGNRLNPVSRRNRVLYTLVESFVVPVAALLGTLPFTLLWFGKIALLSIPVNAVACFVFPIYMVASALCVLLWYAGFDTTFLCRGVDAFASLIDLAVGSWGDLVALHSSTVLLGEMSLLCLTSALIVLGIAIYSSQKRRKAIACCLATLLILCTGCESWRKEERMLIAGDAFSTRVLLSRGVHDMEIILEGAGKASPQLLHFFDSEEKENIESISARTGMVDLSGIRLFIVDNKSDAIADTDVDYIFFSRKYTKEDFGAFLDAMPQSIVLLSPSLQASIYYSLEEDCRIRGRKWISLAHEAVFREF